MKSGKCPKCNCAKVIKLPVLDRGGKGSEYQLSAVVNAGDRGFFSNNQQYLALNAYVCSSCGFAELYAEGMKEKWDAL